MPPSEIPEYIAYFDTAFERVERTFTAALDRMATKAELDLVRLELKVERDAREQLQRELKADEEARNAKMRRLWGSIWAVLGTVILAGSTLASLIIHR